jgi:hypothetical protein
MRSLAGLFLVVGAACTPITEPEGSAAPVNECVSEVSCNAFPSDAGVRCSSVGSFDGCITGSTTPFVLLVTPSTLGSFAPGSTFAISSDAFYAGTPTTVCSDQNTLEATALLGRPSETFCYVMPSPQVVVGAYTVNAQQAVAAGRYLGAPVVNGAVVPVSLPVTTTYWPEWAVPGSSAAIDARLLNLPLPPVVANLVTDTGELQVTAAPPGDEGSFPLTWLATLPASVNPTATYWGVVQVDPPFNDAYPDYALPITVLPGGCPISENCNTAPIIGLGASFASATPPGEPVVVTRADGSVFEPGWTAYFRDPLTLDVLSSLASVAGTMAAITPIIITPHLVGDTDLLILDPPPGSLLPELSESYLELGAGVTYPALPPSLHVSGTVTGPNGEAVSATLLFYSSLLDDVTSCLAAGTQPDPPSNLFYESLTSTADLLSAHGAVGDFSIDLPQGDYSVIVQPSPDSNFAKATNSLLHIALPEHPVCSGASAPLEGVDIQVSARISVSGEVVTADGRPLAAAYVDYTPAASLAPFQNTSPVAVDGWPRPFTTTTNDLGQYTILADPGTYDVTFRPADGTVFPWVVTPNVVVMQGSLAPATVVVPAPFFLSAILHDPSDGPLANAVVQAFAFANGVAVAIGETLTGEDGYFELALTTPPLTQ